MSELVASSLTYIDPNVDQDYVNREYFNQDNIAAERVEPFCSRYDDSSPSLFLYHVDLTDILGPQHVHEGDSASSRDRRHNGRLGMRRALSFSVSVVYQTSALSISAALRHFT